MTIRRATTHDADAIARVHARSWPFAYAGLLPDEVIAQVVDGRARRASRLAELMADPSSPQRVWVATHEGAVVGMAIWGPSHDEDATDQTADVEAIYLDPDVVGQGIGRRLFERLVADVRSQGFTDATLWVLDSNRRARRFYEAAGWHADGATKQEERPGGILHEVRYRRPRTTDEPPGDEQPGR